MVSAKDKVTQSRELLGRDVDVVDDESSSGAVVGEVGETENGDGDVAQLAVDESDARDEDSRHR